MSTPDLLTTLRTRQERLPMEIPHAGDWCPAKNCGQHCGPEDCTCRPCNRKPCCQDRIRASRTTRPLQASRAYQPSLFSTLTPERTPR